ncbi:MAG: prepilin-type N-terminal cleavage/methylation domain-containing protein [Planctomycetota bacterium]|jgi:prepilin-type N-terminal cleavage/methylation domain-containing protein
MESREDKAGVTLVEILIAIGVLSVLVSLVLAGATRLHNQGNERLVRETFSLLDGALQEYHESTGRFPEAVRGDPTATQTLWAELSSERSSQAILERVSRSLLRSDAAGEAPKIYDPWRVLVKYSYAEGDNFPLLESAGPDRNFETPDDVRNR